MSRVFNFTALPARFADLAPALGALAANAVAGITVPADRRDPTFQLYGVLAGFIRAAANVEVSSSSRAYGRSSHMTAASRSNPRDFRLPLIEAAIAAVPVRSNDALALKAVRPGGTASRH